MTNTEAPSQCFIYPALPDDQNLLAAFGALTIVHGWLEYELRMMIKTLSGVDLKTVIEATSFQGVSETRERVKKLARKRFGEGSDLIKIQSFLERARKLSESRNEFIHSLWCNDLDVGLVLISSDHSATPIPTKDEINKISNDIDVLIKEIRKERLEGFIAEAVK
ncbi:MAG: hypothetical protein EBQ96_01365 [Proteobacteria bacterium]|nr:hypothetical protein [Pseudomonadota bacterium]